MNSALKCVKCQGEMVQGFIPDYVEGAKYISSWVEGQPQSSVWAYTKVPFGGGIPIGAYRCKGCGYLEFYAHERFAAK